MSTIAVTSAPKPGKDNPNENMEAQGLKETPPDHIARDALFLNLASQPLLECIPCDLSGIHMNSETGPVHAAFYFPIAVNSHWGSSEEVRVENRAFWSHPEMLHEGSGGANPLKESNIPGPLFGEQETE